MTKFKTFFAALALNIPALAAAAASEPAKVDIAFTGIEAPKGAIMVAVFDSEESYNGGKPVRGAMVPVSSATANTVLEGLPAGRYAMKMFHDVDGDGKMGTNPFGMPTEPFAFSNNAPVNMGPPKWADAAFDVKAGANTHSISFK